MKFSDIKIGEIFIIGNTPSYPKRKTENGYVDIRDNIIKIAEDLPWDLRLLTKKELDVLGGLDE